MTTSENLVAHAPVLLTYDQWLALEQAYAAPPRAYHSWNHVLAVVDHWLDVDRRHGWRHRTETFLALLYHDAIYVPGRSDNEDRSADFAHDQVHHLEHVDVGEVERLIRLTYAHGKLTSDMVDRDASHFLDCDMAILGAPPDVYSAYEDGIRLEYAHVPLNHFRSGRERFIQRLLALPRIFLSDDFHQRLDRQARINLQSAFTAYSES